MCGEEAAGASEAPRARARGVSGRPSKGVQLGFGRFQARVARRGEAPGEAR
jgi:hypothetical protein